jgi:hypothetical protein
MQNVSSLSKIVGLPYSSVALPKAVEVAPVDNHGEHYSILNKRTQPSHSLDAIARVR